MQWGTGNNNMLFAVDILVTESVTLNTPGSAPVHMCQAMYIYISEPTVPPLHSKSTVGRRQVVKVALQ